MIAFVSIITVQEGKKEEFLHSAGQMAEGSRMEEGNVEYHIYEQMDAENTVAFIEKWKDQEALDLHETMEHFTSNIGKLKAFCAKPPMRSCFSMIS